VTGPPPIEPPPKVVAGYVSFTEITDPAEHRSYNEWHLFDHLPEQLPLGGIVSGERWVASPACRATWTAAGDLLDPVHYLTLYLLAEPLAETVAAFRGKGRELRDLGRFHQQRRALLSGPFPVLEQRAAPRVLVSAEAVPHRPNLGVFVRVERVGGERTGQAATGGPTGEVVVLLEEVPGVAGVWVFGGPAADRTVGEVRLTVAWLDGDPIHVAHAAAARAELTPTRAVLLQGVFERVAPAGPFDWFETGS
jgi:hypothetical protein